MGEGSTPWLRNFFDGLGIEEAEWMPACNATYKSRHHASRAGPRKPGFERYFHPFVSMLDNLTLHQFTDNVHARLDGAEVEAHPDRFFVAAALARQGRGPRAQRELPLRPLVRLPLRRHACSANSWAARRIERGVTACCSAMSRGWS